MDLLVSLNQEKLNQAIAKLHGNPQIHNTLFEGAKAGSFDGVDFKVEWNVIAAPQFDFRQPTVNEWMNGIKADGQRSFPMDNAFIINLPDIFISFNDSINTRTTNFPLTIIGHIPNDGSGSLLTADAVSIDLSGLMDMDQHVAREEFIPDIINSVNEAVSGLQVPVPSFAGVHLTPARAAISSKNLVVGYNLIDRGQPDLSNVFVPDKPFSIMASQDLIRMAGNYLVTTEIQGKTFPKGDRVGGSGFYAQYNVDAHIDFMQVEPSGRPTMLRAFVGMRAMAQAGIEISIDPTKW